LPVPEALAIARQIADALDAAHEQGIIHRDLKPANVKIRPDGTVKVLDFGLAKAVDPGSASGVSGPPSNSPTLTSQGTALGLILGTAAYMAPEQARGRAVDRRADVWAFGVVLYEMLTGRRAFEGEDVSDILASVLRQDIDWSALPATTPAPVRRLLRRCLERDPRKRLRSIGDARLEIDEPDAAPAGSPAVTAGAKPSLLCGVRAAAGGAGGLEGFRPARAPFDSPSGRRDALSRFGGCRDLTGRDDGGVSRGIDYPVGRERDVGAIAVVVDGAAARRSKGRGSSVLVTR
jgi:hypothetical protein